VTGLWGRAARAAARRLRWRLDAEGWNRDRLRRGAERWYWHLQADLFLRAGGALVPPPLTGNIGLTNKCNLRCEICGSQRHLDEAGVRRRHMEIETFEAVAKTLFPVLSVVELNSQGDPLLHPQVEQVLDRIAAHRCAIKLQTNGTLFTPSIIALLAQQHGMVMLSLDAVGPRFDDVRRGGRWAVAEPGILRLLSARDPRKLSIGIYPTLTRRTMGEAIAVVEWAADHGVDSVVFHRYNPVAGAAEEAPSGAEYQQVRTALVDWARRHDGLELRFEGQFLSRHRAEPIEPADPLKAQALTESFSSFPTERGKGDPIHICTAPLDYVEIGLEGQVSACCRSQDVPLGYATSAEAFAAAWCGKNYGRIRRSLERQATGPYPLPNCAECVAFFAPNAGKGREAMRYEPLSPPPPEGLEASTEEPFWVEAMQEDSGHCYAAVLPPGTMYDAFELWEDDCRLGPGAAMHDDIRATGQGRYSIWGCSIFFSASDNTDPRRNGRAYSLRPRSVPANEAGPVQWAASTASNWPHVVGSGRDSPDRAPRLD